jgi:Tol biopolymer transport system component
VPVRLSFPRAMVVIPAVLAAACDAVPPSAPTELPLSAAKQATTASKMLISRGGQVWSINDDGTGAAQLTFTELNDMPSWAPDGKRVLYSAQGSAPGIYSMNADGTAVTRITIPPAGAVDLQPVALGKRVAFRRDNGVTRTIYAVNIDGTGLIQLTRGPLDAEFGASPKGDKIAFASGTEASFGFDIYLLNVVTGGITQLTYSPTIYKAGISFSPDGKQIAFTRADPGVPEMIFIMKTDGTQVTRVSQSNDYDFLPRWSPDGKRIGFTSFRAVPGVYSMLVNGTDVQYVTGLDFMWAWAR